MPKLRNFAKSCHTAVRTKINELWTICLSDEKSSCRTNELLLHWFNILFKILFFGQSKLLPSSQTKTLLARSLAWVPTTLLQILGTKLTVLRTKLAVLGTYRRPNLLEKRTWVEQTFLWTLTIYCYLCLLKLQWNLYWGFGCTWCQSLIATLKSAIFLSVWWFCIIIYDHRAFIRLATVQYWNLKIHVLMNPEYKSKDHSSLKLF